MNIFDSFRLPDDTLPNQTPIVPVLFFTIFLPHFLSISNIKRHEFINFVYLDKYWIVFCNIGIFLTIPKIYKKAPDCCPGQKASLSKENTQQQAGLTHRIDNLGSPVGMSIIVFETFLPIPTHEAHQRDPCCKE